MSSDILEYLKECWSKQKALKRLPFHIWEEQLNKGKLRFFSWKKNGFFRLVKDFRSYPQGTFFNHQIFVYGYPHIPRIYTLKTGLQRYLCYPFYAEEKIEGYNVRFVMVEGEVLPFTRRGYICPFALDRWEDFLPNLPVFFEENPGLAVCCEVAGPENPFVSEYPPYIKEDINFFVFDFMEGASGKFVNPSKKYALIEKYSFPHPEINGPLDPAKDYKEIKNLLARYHREGREGVVFKPEKEGKRVKYVTPFSNIEDIKVVFPYLGDIDLNFISLRMVRLAMNLYEFKELREEVLNKAGKEFFEEVLSVLENPGPVQEVFRVRFKKENNFHALLAHFKAARISVEIKEKIWENGYLKVVFSKTYPKATHFWKQKLEGWGEVD